MKKIWIIALLAFILSIFYVTDYFISQQYEYELISNKNAIIVADGETSTRFNVRLTKKGKPVEGHVIYLFASNGSLPISRVVTDENGEFTFRYYSYAYLDDRLTPLDDVTITLQDESNSVFFQVSATQSFTFKAVKPDEEHSWTDWQDMSSEVR